MGGWGEGSLAGRERPCEGDPEAGRACHAGRAELGSAGNTVSEEDAGRRGCWREGGSR